MENIELSSILSTWVHSTHRVWEWHLSEKCDVMYRTIGVEKYQKYARRNNRGIRYYPVGAATDFDN